MAYACRMPFAARNTHTAGCYSIVQSIAAEIADQRQLHTSESHPKLPQFRTGGATISLLARPTRILRQERRISVLKYFGVHTEYSTYPHG